MKLFFGDSPSSGDDDRDEDEGEDEVGAAAADDWRAQDAQVDAAMVDEIERIDAACRTPSSARPAASSSSRPAAQSRVVQLDDDSDDDIEYVAGHSGFTPVKSSGSSRVKGRGPPAARPKGAFFCLPVKKEPAVSSPAAPVESDIKKRKRLARELREGVSAAVVRAAPPASRPTPLTRALAPLSFPLRRRRRQDRGPDRAEGRLPRELPCAGFLAVEGCVSISGRRPTAQLRPR